jgi:hypothetical protein
MELTDAHLEAIRKTVREVEFGSVTINISANSNKLDLSIQKRVRYDDETDEMAVQNKSTVQRKVLKKA